MKIAILSDIHSNYKTLHEVIQNCLQEEIDKFLFLGDYITDGIYDNETIGLVKNYGDYVVLGNREIRILDLLKTKEPFDGKLNKKPLYNTVKELSENTITYLKELPKARVVTIANKKILLIHGHHLFIEDKIVEEELDKLIDQYNFEICFFGHSHKKEDFVYKNHRFINPGSIGIPSDGPSYKYQIVTIDENIQIENKEMKVKDTLEQRKKEIWESSYYQENKEWCELILASIESGEDKITKAFELLRENVRNKKITDIKEYNQQFCEIISEIVNQKEEIK